MKSIRDFLRDTIGLDHDTIGASILDSAIKKHMQSLNIENTDDYLASLQSSSVRTEELIELVVINETWFFRQPEAFNHLRTVANKKRTSLSRQKPFRVLCLGCSTGEEPYSIAIALQELGISPEHFMIDAVDISDRALSAAKAASYGPSSFDKTGDLSYRDSHFAIADEVYTLNKAIRDCVTFIHGNILHQTCPLNAAEYDIIFCRHVMIYFCEGARDTLIKRLNTLLAGDGTIFVGASETSVLRTNGYSPCKTPSAFAFFKQLENPRKEPENTAPSVKTRKRKSKADQSEQEPFAEVRPPAKLDADEPPPDYCWLSRGISGDRSCEKLDQYIRCYNCPVRVEQGRDFLKSKLPEESQSSETPELTVEEEPQNTSAREHAVIFRLGTEWFAVPSLSIKDISNAAQIHSIPYRSNKMLLGLSHFAGELRLCVSLSAILTNEQSADSQNETHVQSRRIYKRMITLEVQGETWSFPVDEVADIAYIYESDVTPVPSSDSESAIYSRGSTTIDERIINILDLQLLIASLRRGIK